MTPQVPSFSSDALVEAEPDLGSGTRLTLTADHCNAVRKEDPSVHGSGGADHRRKLDSSWTVQQHTRLAPLTWSGSFPNRKKVQPGDALIAFRWMGVLSITAEPESIGVQASVIYGPLPPHSRREEVRRCREGETTVVVATDTIGMGISLPIRRVILCRRSKFDGTQVRDLLTHEIAQIAGRAERFGLYNEGFVLSMADPKRIRRPWTANRRKSWMLCSLSPKKRWRRSACSAPCCAPGTGWRQNRAYGART